MLNSLKRFFAVSEGSIQGLLSLEDLYRAILTALGSGSTIGLAILILQGVLSHVATVFPNPSVASMAAIILTMVLDLLRRQSQGSVPTPPAPLPPVKASA